MNSNPSTPTHAQTALQTKLMGMMVMAMCNPIRRAAEGWV